MYKYLILAILLAGLQLLFAHIVVAEQIDPTKPFGQGSMQGETATEGKLVLESIIHGEGIHTAVINGKVLKPNQTIGQYRLIAVNDDSVLLRSESDEIRLYVFKASVLK